MARETFTRAEIDSSYVSPADRYIYRVERLASGEIEFDTKLGITPDDLLWIGDSR